MLINPALALALSLDAANRFLRAGGTLLSAVARENLTEPVRRRRSIGKGQEPAQEGKLFSPKRAMSAKPSAPREPPKAIAKALH